MNEKIPESEKLKIFKTKQGVEMSAEQKKTGIKQKKEQLQKEEKEAYSAFRHIVWEEKGGLERKKQNYELNNTNVSQMLKM